MQYGLRFCPSLRRLGETCQACSPALPCARRWVIEWGLAPEIPAKGATAMCRGGQQEPRTGHRPRRRACRAVLPADFMVCPRDRRILDAWR